MANNLISEEATSSYLNKSVKLLTDRGLAKVPAKFVLPPSERPQVTPSDDAGIIRLPVIDLAALSSTELVSEIGRACRGWGFFQVVNHGVPENVISNMMKATTDFFAQPEEERKKYMSDDMTRSVRYGTSMNQNKDRVFAWRDFLKQYCTPLEEMLPLWPSSPPHYRIAAYEYAKAMKALGEKIMEMVVESLGPGTEGRQAIERVKEGTQMMILNYYPACPEPEVTMGIPPHTDYGCLTLLSQDSVGGLQILKQGKWLGVQPLKNALVVNIGDQIEIMSNGAYRSVMHRVLTNRRLPRTSVASLLSLSLESEVAPFADLIGERRPALYRSTNFSEYLRLVASMEYKARAFLDSVRIRKFEA